MHILLIGATGRVGSLVLEEALGRGHTVTALVRNPDALLPRRDGLAIVTGTPLDKEAIQTALVAQPPPTAVITTLGHNRSGPSSGPNHYMADAHANVLAAMRAHGSGSRKKLVVLQALGVADSRPNLFFAMRWLIKYAGGMAGHFADHDLVDEMVREDVEVDAVRVRPTRLEGGEKKPLVFFGNEGEGIGGFAAISMKSVAGFMVDAAEKPDWDGSSPVIAN